MFMAGYRIASGNDFYFASNHLDDEPGSAVVTQPEILEPMRLLAYYADVVNVHQRLGIVICLAKKKCAFPEVKKWRAAIRIGTFGNHTQLLKEGTPPDQPKS
jgi:hypothetical protein